MQKVKVTRKQRQAIRGTNQPMIESLQEGSKHVIGGNTYMGQNARYETFNGMQVKTQKGIPFVKVRKEN